MKPDDIDEILARATRDVLPPSVERAAIERAQSAVLMGLSPVRPLAPIGIFTLGFVLLFAAVASAAAIVLGLHGFHVLSGLERGVIFATLLAASWLTALACARAMRPASGSQLGVLALGFACVAFPTLFAAVFSGYGFQNFVREGVPCLVAGLCLAIPTGVVMVLLLQRGFVLSWASAGVAAGALAGLSGLAMLELHCPNLKAIHVMVWHVAVVAVSGILGWLLGAIADRLHPGKRSSRSTQRDAV